MSFFDTPLNAFLNEIDVIASKIIEKTVSEDEKNNLKLKDIINSNIGAIELTLPNEDSSYIKYLNHNNGKKISFLDLSCSENKTNIFPIIANDKTLKAYAKILNDQNGIERDIVCMNDEISNDIKTINEPEQKNNNCEIYDDFEITDVELNDDKFKLIESDNKCSQTKQNLLNHKKSENLFEKEHDITDNEIFGVESDLLHFSPKFRSNENSDFHKIEKRQITPEIQLQFELLNNRGYLNKKRKFRSAKSKLFKLDQNFASYQVGVVTHDSNNIINSNLRTTKKSKSLIKIILESF